MSNIRSNLASLRFHTPPGTQLPGLLEDLYAWASTQPDGSLGYFRLEGDRLDDFWLPDGTRVASAFVSFMRIVDGSRVGWWRPNGESLDRAPIVVLEGEGGTRAVARSLSEFLTRIAALRTGIHDMTPDPEGPHALEPLRAWLKQQRIDAELDDDALLEPSEALAAWLEAWAQQRDALPVSPARDAVIEMLRPIIGLPPADQPWKTTSADLILTARECHLVGTKRLSVTEGFAAAMRAFRDEDAHELLEAGLWSRATLTLHVDGSLGVKRHYLEEPDTSEIAVDDAGLREDALRAPRTAYWMPEWLAKRT